MADETEIPASGEQPTAAVPEEIVAAPVSADAANIATITEREVRGEDMEIHRPKPVHSWREFFIELGTIVLGIIIAISLEQTVEYLHWQSEVKIAREAIKEEIAANNENLFAFRIAVQPCIDQFIADANKVLADIEAGKKSKGMSNFRYGGGSLLRDSEWQSERASGVLTHFPRSELALMSRYYSQLDNFHDWLNDEDDGWKELSVLKDPPAGMTISDQVRLRVDLDSVQRLNNLIVLNAKRQSQVVEQLGVQNSPPDPVRAKNFCIMSLEDWTDYRTSQNLR